VKRERCEMRGEEESLVGMEIAGFGALSEDRFEDDLLRQR
jgi:hypothetical protein